MGIRIRIFQFSGTNIGHFLGGDTDICRRYREKYKFNTLQWNLNDYYKMSSFRGFVARSFENFIGV